MTTKAETAVAHLLDSLHKATTVEEARVLVERGHDVNGTDKEARTPLHLAARFDNVDVARFLLANGANVNAAMPRGWTPLHYAARHASIEMVKLLVENGANVNAAMEHGLSVAHIAAEKGRVEVIEYLAQNGVDMDAATWRGLSVIQVAVKQSSVDVVQFYLDGGYDVDTKTQQNFTLLHSAAIEGKAEMVEFLLQRGANVHALDKQRRSAVYHALWGQRAKRCSRAYPVIVLLCQYGATWDRLCESELSRRHKRAFDAAKKAHAYNGEEPAMDKNLLWRLGVRASVQHWDSQRQEDESPLSVIPMEAVIRGDEAVKTYLANMKISRADQLISRRKVCVVGPSQWGKTSLVKSLTLSEPSLVHIDDRTIGIDLFAHSFTTEDSNRKTQRHEITFWDFAGHDEYQVAHALFFSKRTLYLLCVDLEQYATMWNAIENAASAREAEHAMVRFLRTHIFRWVRAIVTRQSDAEFVVVGTKRDRIQDEKLVDLLWYDLSARLHEWMGKFADEIDQECSEIDSQSSGDGRSNEDSDEVDSIVHFQSLKKRLAKLFAKDWIVVSSATKESIESALAELESKISHSDRSFVMPAKYTSVLEAIRTRRDQAARLSNADRIASTIIPVRALCSALMKEVEDLDADECRDILQMLHDLGDVLWYQQEASGVLKDTVIIDPTLVLDFVREVITHEYSDRVAAQSNNHVQEGRLTHDFLRQRTLWKAIDEELLFAFKQLLQYFQLAYPADNEEMDWDSDLIVPTYWKASNPSNKDVRRLVQQKSLIQRHGVLGASHFCWEYELSAEVSETVFEHFAVQSYSSFLERTVQPNRIETFLHGDCAALITLSPGDSSRDVIRVEVAVSDASLGWHHMRYYVMALETVLDGYPGLVVSRYIVDPMSNDSTRHRLSSALAALEDALWMGKDVSTVQATMPWMTQDMQWYLEKAWRQPGALQQLRTQELVREAINKVDVLKKLVVADEARRKYPALWTLSYDLVTKKISLRMLSDLSGDCFHDPIEIQAPAVFLAKYGNVIQTGLSILSNVVPEIVSLGVIQKVVDLFAPVVENQVVRATSVYNLIDQLDLSGGGVVQSASERLSPRDAVALLRELLQLHDSAFDELRVSDSSKLQCAATSDGHFIWAHRQEIMALGEKLTPCDPDDMRGFRRTLSESSTTSHASTAAASVATDDSALRLRLSIIGINGLSAWDWRETYCSWQLVHPSTSTQIASGSTAPHSDGAVPPPWRDVEFALRNVTSIEMLRQCLLAVKVKRPSRCLGIVKLVGEGLVAVGVFVPVNQEEVEPGYTVAVSLGGDGERSVACRLTTASGVHKL